MSSRWDLWQNYILMKMISHSEPITLASKGGDSPHSNFTLKIEWYIWLTINQIQIAKSRCSVEYNQWIKKTDDTCCVALLLHLSIYVLCIYCNILFWIKMLTVGIKYFDNFYIWNKIKGLCLGCFVLTIAHREQGLNKCRFWLFLFPFSRKG